MATEATATVDAESVGALLELGAERHGDVPALRVKQGGEWHDRSHAQLRDEVRSLARGLIELGVQPGERVCILANTRPEWTLLAYAIWCAGAITVPIYPTNSPEECEWVAGNSGAAVVICEDESQLEKIRAVRASLPELREIVLIDGVANDAKPLAAITVSDTRDDAEDDEATDDDGDDEDEDEDGEGDEDEPDELERRTKAVKPDDPLLIIYTSGTTGPPKGCVLTHGNGLALCGMVEELGIIKAGDVSYLYLPLAHVFAQLVQISGLYLGCTLAYFGGDTKRIIPELQEVQPDYFASVPRIFEKVYAQATSKMQDATPEQREQFEQAVKLGVRVRTLEARGEPVPAKLRDPFKQADELIFKNVRAIFGGKLREATTGAAPIAPEILEFFFASGCAVMEGYGMTETTGTGTTNTREEHKFGTVGRAMPGVEIKIADDGEILMKGPNVFAGYWQNEDATNEVLDRHGWLATGDLGALDDEDYLHITGRKKDIIITAGGKNLTPANIENDLKQSPFISQAVMYGDRKPYPVALVTLDAEEIGPWAREHGLPEDVAALAREPQVIELVQGVLDAANRKYAQVEQVKRFAILDHDLSQDAGELTPTLKVKRNVVYENYGDVFEELYAQPR
jgi:long-chain acyl-CoA synthetase